MSYCGAISDAVGDAYALTVPQWSGSDTSRDVLRPEPLSDPASSVFALKIGTAPDYASNLDAAIHMVYVRANYNANLNANNGKLPWNPTTYFSKDLVSQVIKTYRNLAGTGTVKHLTGETISTNLATDCYNQVVAKLLIPYSNLKADTVRTILREFFYATIDQKIDPEIILPAVERFPTPGAQAMMAMQEEQRKLQEDKKKLEEQGFFGKMGAAFLNVFRAPGDLASAATTTATVAGIGVVAVVLGGTSLLIVGIYKKFNQVDINKNLSETQQTIRKVGPDVARLAVASRGMK